MTGGAANTPKGWGIKAGGGVALVREGKVRHNRMRDQIRLDKVRSDWASILQYDGSPRVTRYFTRY